MSTAVPADVCEFAHVIIEPTNREVTRSLETDLGHGMPRHGVWRPPPVNRSLLDELDKRLEPFATQPPSLSVPATSDITIVTLCEARTPAWEKVCKLLRQNCLTFARLHGYGLLLWDTNNAAPRHVLWSKIPSLSYALRTVETEYVWWQDADSLFVNPSQDLEALKPAAGLSLTISGDYMCFINSGHLMLRNNAWSLAWLDRIWAFYPGTLPFTWPEQANIVYLLSGSPWQCRRSVLKGCCEVPAAPKGRPHAVDGLNNATISGPGTSNPSSLPNPGVLDANVDLRPYRAMHTYPSDFVRGKDLVIHFARNHPQGHRRETREELMARYSTMLEPAAASPPPVGEARDA